MSDGPPDWLDEGATSDQDGQVDEYDLTSSPNDFNVSTIVDFIRSGAVKVPGFQRNYVWDIKRASKLIESLIIGLPVPQVFLYEEGKNSFLVIDGQQRLMTLFYFVHGRFPRKDKRVELRRIFDEEGTLPESVLADDQYFENFNLQLSEVSPGQPNKFNKRNYQTLDDYKTSFNLRTIRNVIVKQVKPSDDDSSIYEMFNRLNTGGVLLTPQEIRSSLYHSAFYDELFRLNLEPLWRDFIGQAQPDLHMRDIEVLLRVIALAYRGDNYVSSMVKFLNKFSKDAKGLTGDQVYAISQRFRAVLESIRDVPRTAFLTRQQRLSLPLFESVLAAADHALQSNPEWVIDPIALSELSQSEDFLTFTQEATTNTTNVKGRLKLAREMLIKGADASR